jgi:signal peptidase II
MSTEPAVPVNPESPAPTPSATPATEAPPQSRRSSRRLVACTFALAALVLAVDQLTKQWAISTLVLGEQHDIIGEYLSIRLVMNPGAALGIGEGYTWVLTILVVVVAAVIVRVISRIRSRAWAITLGLLLGGALGNLGDRLFREPGFAHGKVVDFIGYWNWFTGNVADIAIVVAAVMLALLSLMGVGLDGTRESHRTREKGPDPAEPAA